MTGQDFKLDFLKSRPGNPALKSLPAPSQSVKISPGFAQHTRNMGRVLPAITAVLPLICSADTKNLAIIHPPDFKFNIFYQRLNVLSV